MFIIVSCATPVNRACGETMMLKLRAFDWRPAGCVAAAVLAGAVCCGGPARADYTLKVNPADDRGIWRGWGCSLCWWGNGVGNSAYQDQYADLFFSTKTVSFFGQSLPGLGMNIARYNVGGVGRPGDIPTLTENWPSRIAPERKIEGYWRDWQSKDPASKSWDWSRDANQRAMLKAACARGVDTVELFSNAPMWWMTDKKSSSGGALQQWNRRDFAVYLATVAAHATKEWKLPVVSIDPFNEPAAGWWRYPGSQEGCNIPREQQAEVLTYLREELDSRGMKKMSISASDENSVGDAQRTYDYLKGQTVTLRGKTASATDLIDRVNVHGYSGLAPWRDNNAREKLRATVGKTPLWQSEFGDPDGGGMAFAQQITEDINFLRPEAWIYWQAAEPSSGWGLVNGAFGGELTAPDRAKPTWVYTKYLVMAQFTRFLRPGDQVIGTDDHNTIAAYDARHRRLSLITLNYSNAQTIGYDLSGLAHVGKTATVTVTTTDAKKHFVVSSVDIANKAFSMQAEPNAVYSVSLDDVRLR